LIVTARNKDRTALNKEIRATLKSQGKLGGQEQTYVVREAKSMGPVEQHFAASYSVGDVLVVNGGKTGIKVGSQGRVTAVDQASHTITLDVKGQSRVIDIRQHGASLAAYREKVQSFVAGDKIVFLKNDKNLGVQNGMTGQVVALDETGMMIKTDSGRELTINVRDRYNYVSWIRRNHVQVPGADSKRSDLSRGSKGAEPDSKDPKWQTYNSVYVAMSRGKEDITIYTDDVAKLEQAAMKEQQKTSTLDHREVGIPEPQKTPLEADGITKNENDKGTESGTDKTHEPGSHEAEKAATERSREAQQNEIER
jgi:ATP-dependent exoDNAse (exonuclease V) alpha subunit